MAKVMFLHVSVILFMGGSPGRENPPGQGEPSRQGGPPQQGGTPPGSRLQNTVYERPVHILLECILVQCKFPNL